jgi:hypothetical protein
MSLDARDLRTEDALLYPDLQSKLRGVPRQRLSTLEFWVNEVRRQQKQVGLPYGCGVRGDCDSHGFQ